MCPHDTGFTSMSISKRVVGAGAFAAFALSGCYVVPVAPDGTPLYPAYPVNVPAPIVLPVPAATTSAPPPPVVAAPAAPAVLQARLYPSNDAATRVGMLSGTVTNMM